VKNTIWILLISLVVNVTAQNKLWELKAYKHQPYTDVTLNYLSDDTLYFKSSDGEHKVDFSLLTELKWDGESHSGKGILLGALVGGLGGLLLAPDVDKSNPISTLGSAGEKGAYTVYGTLGGGLLGLFIGANIYEKERYNFTKMPLEEKRQILIKLINK